MSLRVHRQVGSFGEVLSEQAVGVLVGTPLPRTSRITEVDIDVRRQAKTAMIREFLAAVPGQGFKQFAGSFFACLMRADTTVWVSLLGTFANIRYRV